MPQDALGAEPDILITDWDGAAPLVCALGARTHPLPTSRPLVPSPLVGSELSSGRYVHRARAVAAPRASCSRAGRFRARFILCEQKMRRRAAMISDAAASRRLTYFGPRPSVTVIKHGRRTCAVRCLCVLQLHGLG